MKRKLLIPTKPLSLNEITCRDVRYKSKAYKAWYPKILEHLSNTKNKKALRDLREHFDPKKHFFAIDFWFFYPEHILFTLLKQCSAKAHDTSNIEKPLQDLIFLPDFYGTTPPYSAENLNMDDKYILDAATHQRPASDYLIRVELEIRSLQRFFPLSEDSQ